MVVTRTTIWADNQVLTAAALNGEFNNLLNAPAITNSDISASAVIAYSKLNLANSIIDSDISSIAAIAASKISDTAVTLTASQTVTNKRITKRITAITDSATPTPNGDTTDMYEVTALGQGATFGAPTGTPTDGQPLIIRVKDNGTARTLAFNAIYRFSTDLPAPTTTVISKTFYLGFIYNSTDSKWDNIAQLNNI